MTELVDLLPRVDNKFAKLGEILFLKDKGPAYEHPDVIAYKEAIAGKKKKKKTPKEVLRD